MAKNELKLFGVFVNREEWATKKTKKMKYGRRTKKAESEKGEMGEKLHLPQQFFLQSRQLYAAL